MISDPLSRILPVPSPPSAGERVRERGCRAPRLARFALSLTLPPRTGGGDRKDSGGTGCPALA
jgi:hypothetical protein